MYIGTKLNVFNSTINLILTVKIISLNKKRKLSNINFINNNFFLFKAISCNLNKKMFKKKKFFIFIIGLKYKIKNNQNGIYISFNKIFALNCLLNKKQLVLDEKFIKYPLFYNRLTLQFFTNKNNFFF